MTATPTAQVITADMLWELTRTYPNDEQRIWRGAEMVVLVERTATPGLWLVGSASDPDAAYQVDQFGCSCPDFQKRGGLCKHRAAVSLFQQAERADAEAYDPTLMALVAHPLVRVDPEDSILDLWPGEPCEMAPPVKVGTITRLPMPAELQVLSDELFGEE